MKAVNKFKKLIAHRRPQIMSSILSEEDSARFSQPPITMQRGSRTVPVPHKSHSVTAFDRRPVEGALVVEGVHRELDILWGPDGATTGSDGDHRGKSSDPLLKARAEDRSKATSSPPVHAMDQRPDHALQPQVSRMSTGGEEDEQYLAFRPEHSHPQPNHARSYDEARHRGHAHDPLQDHLYLYIGPSSYSGAGSHGDRRATFAPHAKDEGTPVVSESPGAADIDIYETAYRDEIERIRQRCKEEGKEEEPTVYLTRRVDARLAAVGQLAGRFVAKGEEGLERFGSATGWKDKRARVTDVSRALHAAARQEYEKRRQDRRHKDRTRAAQADGSRPSAEANETAENQPDLRQHEASGAQSRESSAPQSRTLSMFAQTALAGRAMEKGKQAKESFRNLMGMMKDGGGDSKEGNDTS